MHGSKNYSSGRFTFTVTSSVNPPFRKDGGPGAGWHNWLAQSCPSGLESFGIFWTFAPAILAGFWRNGRIFLDLSAI